MTPKSVISKNLTKSVKYLRRHAIWAIKTNFQDYLMQMQADITPNSFSGNVALLYTNVTMQQSVY